VLLTSSSSSPAGVNTAAINLNFTRIVAPIDGVAGIAQAQVGDLVSPSGGLLTTISMVDPIRDYFSVTEQEYLALRKQFSGSNAERWKLELILADGTTYSHPGEFYFADRQVTPSTGAIQLAALFANPGNILRPGQYGKVRGVMRVQRDALLIPQAAVNEQQGSYIVDVVGEDGKVAISNGSGWDRAGTMWAVEGGLKAGEKAIVEGQQNLKPGTTVQTKPFKADAPAQ
jgi:membrane fusion protein, multidrug efflux system